VNQDGVVLLGDDDGGIGIGDAGGESSLHTNSGTRGGTPTPALPRKRERERTGRMVRVLLTRFV
jgi:hypothetical protein